MALVNCRECLKQISSLAVTCPHCGAPGLAASNQHATPTRAPAPTPAAMRPSPRPAKPMSEKQLFTIGAAFVALLALGYGTYLLRKPPTRGEQIAQVREQRLAREAEHKANYEKLRTSLLAKAESDLSANKPRDVISALQPYAQWLDAESQAVYKVALAATEAERKRVEKEAAEKERVLREAAEKQRSAERAIVARIGEKPVASAWDGSYYEVERYLKRVAHDPDSIDMAGCSEALQTDAGWTVRCEYRGRNAFGGLILKNGLFVIKHGQVVSSVDL